jgi:hypothetical protein
LVLRFLLGIFVIFGVVFCLLWDVGVSSCIHVGSLRACFDDIPTIQKRKKRKKKEKKEYV